MRMILGRNPGRGGAGYAVTQRYDGKFHIVWTICDYGNGSYTPEQGYQTPAFDSEYDAIEEFLHRRAEQIADGKLVITAPEYIEMARQSCAESAQERG
jgi:hypothetical protein